MTLLTTSPVVDLEPSTLRQWTLPMPDHGGDKEERGRLLIIGGSCEIPGAVLLAAHAALRAGVGKLAIAVGSSIATQIALQVPEARVIALPETERGGIAVNAVEALAPLARKIDAVLVGPGMQDEDAICRFVRALMPHFPDASFVLDANAMGVVRGDATTSEAPRCFAEGSDLPLADTLPDDGQSGESSRNEAPFRFTRPVLLTPHAGEMAHLTGIDKAIVQQQPAETARDAANRWNAVVALKGAITVIAHPDGRQWRHEGGNIGLATSGSGDTLAGIIGGLAARGAELEQACSWGVALHAAAGEKLAKRIGLLGYMAREIPDEIPALLTEFAHAED